MIKSAFNQTPVVYGEWGDNAVFLLEDEATERCQLFQGLSDSRTWGELEKAIWPLKHTPADTQRLECARGEYRRRKPGSSLSTGGIFRPLEGRSGV